METVTSDQITRKRVWIPTSTPGKILWGVVLFLVVAWFVWGLGVPTVKTLWAKCLAAPATSPIPQSPAISSQQGVSVAAASAEDRRDDWLEKERKEFVGILTAKPDGLAEQVRYHRTKEFYESEMSKRQLAQSHEREKILLESVRLFASKQEAPGGQAAAAAVASIERERVEKANAEKAAEIERRLDQKLDAVKTEFRTDLQKLTSPMIQPAAAVAPAPLPSAQDVEMEKLRRENEELRRRPVSSVQPMVAPAQPVQEGFPQMRTGGKLPIQGGDFLGPNRASCEFSMWELKRKKVMVTGGDVHVVLYRTDTRDVVTKPIGIPDLTGTLGPDGEYFPPVNFPTLDRVQFISPTQTIRVIETKRQR